jgi:hypothetical protein
MGNILSISVRDYTVRYDTMYEALGMLSEIQVHDDYASFQLNLQDETDAENPMELLTSVIKMSEYNSELFQCIIDHYYAKTGIKIHGKWFDFEEWKDTLEANVPESDR